MLEAFDLSAHTSKERAHSAGKLRNGEELALEDILDTVDAPRKRFVSLAPHGHGTDDSKVKDGTGTNGAGAARPPGTASGQAHGAPAAAGR